MPDSLDSWIETFLEELEHANRSHHTLRAYRADLRELCKVHEGSPRTLDVATLERLAARHVHLSPATRARRQAAVASFLRWAVRRGRLEGNPMDRMERVHRAPAQPRGVPRARVEKVLSAIPVQRKRDRLLFRLIFETGLRVGEALGIHVEDLDLSPDDEHLSVLGKGRRRRTVLLDDERLVRLLRGYLDETGYRHGPLFRAEINGRGGALRYQSVHSLWQRYCREAGVTCTIHQLRHAHATELVRDGVSLATIRKRLGHKSLQSTLVYADQSDEAADSEIRAWRRRKAKP